jgi:argininosuccinate lyase
MRAANGRIGLEEEDVHNALEHRLSLVSPEAAARVHLGARATTRCSPRCGCT